MKARGRVRWRMVVWAVGSALTLGYYFVNAIPRPRRTSIGVECRLLGLGEAQTELQESPSGKLWLLVPALAIGESSVVASRPLSVVMQRFCWPGAGTGFAQMMSPFVTGTWLVEGHAMCQVWSLEAEGWLDDGRLWSRGWGPMAPPGAPADNLWFRDVRRGRTVRRRWSDLGGRIGRKDRDRISAELSYGSAELHGYDEEESDPVLRSALTSALEELPPEVARGWKYGHDVIRGRGVYLVHTLAAKHQPNALYAVSDAPAPRVLWLARNARPLALGRDGRTLFFERNRALWRLDLRKPLSELLDEVRVPDLRDPLAR